MFCPKCRQYNEDNVYYCKRCGERLSDTVPTYAETSTGYASYESVASTATSSVATMMPTKKKSHKGLIIFTVFVCLLSAGVSIYAFMGGFRNLKMEDPIRYYVEGINDGDVDRVLYCANPERREILKKSDEYDEFKDYIQNFKSRYLDGKKLSYSIKSKEKFDSTELIEFEESMNEDLKSWAEAVNVKHKDIDISEAYDVEVDLKCDGETETNTFIVYKVGYRWYIYNI